MKSPNISEDYIIQKRLDIGKKLKEIRESRGLTMDQLGEKLDIGRATVSKIEAGKWNFGIDTLSVFSIVLEFDINIVLK